MSEWTEQQEAVRERVIGFLLFLTSKEASDLLHEYVSPAKLAFEMCKIWFNHIFDAGMRYLDNIKADYSEEKAELFRSSFDDEEWKSLERFHHFWELRLDMLPDKYRRQEEFPGNDTWTNIRRDAGYVLRALAPDLTERQKALAESVATIRRQHNNQLSPTRDWRALLLPPGSTEEQD